MTRIKNLIIAVDNWFIDKAQSLYLWVFDWIGIYLGSVIFIDGAINTCSYMARGSNVLAFVIFFFTIVLALPMYLIQAHGMKELLNRAAEQEITGTFYVTMRIFFNVQNLFFLIGSILTQDYSYTVSFSCGFVFWYLLCVKVRDREPKEFKFWKLAPQGSA